MTDDPKTVDYSYESAVKALLSPGIHQATTKEEIARSARRRTRTVLDMRFYWQKIVRMHSVGQEGKEAKRPLLIHVTGTKGKGSTACMCEALLRGHGYATGLFTSPHLIDIRERIRWNGRPIHESIFADVYWEVRRALESDDEVSDINPPPKLPGYFRMLTLMGLHTFLHKLSGKVDVVILEVGMGGRYDATNFLDASKKHFRRVANGVTLLDLDHARILGDTLEKIAWDKGGIFSVDKLNPGGTTERPSDSSIKTSGAGLEGVGPRESEELNDKGTFLSPKAFILNSNTDGVVTMMQRCALLEGKGSELCMVDSVGSKLKDALRNKELTLGLAGRHQYGNATLAIALCQSVTTIDVVANENADGKVGENSIGTNSPTTIGALASAKWPGRCQTLKWSGTGNQDKALSFYLDGAHTPQSLEATVDWMQTKIDTTEQRIKMLPILVFNCSHERNPVDLLELFLRPAAVSSPTQPSLRNIHLSFSKVYFAKSDCTRPSPVAKASAESILEERGIPLQSELMIGSRESRTWQETLGTIWKHLITHANEDSLTETSETDRNITKEHTIRCNMSASQVLKDIQHQLNDTKELQTTQVFVTGSLYLVGSFLTALEWKEKSSPPL